MRMPPRTSRLLLALGLLSLTACGWDGHFTALGYSTRPNYDPTIRTVYVPIFRNVSFRKGVEFKLTEAVVREIESKTPFRVVNCREQADTELLGRVVNWRKGMINFDQLGEVREAEVGLAVELTWRDLRAGRGADVLSAPGVPGGEAQPTAPPILVEPIATFIPELGGSLGSAEKQVVDHLAVRIVHMMEKGW